MSRTAIDNVILEENSIIINNINHPACVTSFIRSVNLARKRKRYNINILFNCDKGGIFPNACLPVFILMQKYHELFSMNFDIHINNKYLQKCFSNAPLKPTGLNIKELDNPFDKIFCYSDEPGQVASIVQAYIDCLSKTTQCNEGVLSGLIWCINEVMDNVLVHSGEKQGYVMAQYHKNNNIFTLCVFDFGIGIYDSLSCSEKHKPATEIDALTMAIQEGVGDGKGQGNGLYGLYRIVAENGGELCITSGKSSIKLKKSEFSKFENSIYVSDRHKSTIVDFKLNLSKKIDITSALKSLGGFDGFDIRIDNMTDDDSNLRYDIYRNSSGTGTRLAGKELRNDILNTIIRTNSPIILDFINVKACSSSFIDELIAKMITELGFLKFNEYIKIQNMNPLVSHLCERSIAIRTHNSWDTIINEKK